jgi:hypothetical protein
MLVPNIELLSIRMSDDAINFMFDLPARERILSPTLSTRWMQLAVKASDRADGLLPDAYDRYEFHLLNLILGINLNTDDIDWSDFSDFVDNGDTL